MGETLQVPIGYKQYVYNADGAMTYFDLEPDKKEYLQQDHLLIEKYYMSNKTLCAELSHEFTDYPDSKYMIYNIETKVVNQFANAAEYDTYAVKNQLPPSRWFYDFAVHYNKSPKETRMEKMAFTLKTAIIKTLPVTKLIGDYLTMSLANNRTTELWRSFMPRRREIINSISTDMYSMQIYSTGYFTNFSPTTEFEKWAAVPVTDFNVVPEGMETFTIPEGRYAVFHYTGAPENGAEVFGYIFQQWLPQSGYELDNRPHFEVLGEKYKNGNPNSEEEIWIPVK